MGIRGVRITSRNAGCISAENTTMKRVSEEVGFRLHADSSGESLAEINL
jgi:hypothetical protein